MFRLARFQSGFTVIIILEGSKASITVGIGTERDGRHERNERLELGIDCNGVVLFNVLGLGYSPCGVPCWVQCPTVG